MRKSVENFFINISFGFVVGELIQNKLLEKAGPGPLFLIKNAVSKRQVLKQFQLLSTFLWM
jgi:hypothetical protein